MLDCEDTLGEAVLRVVREDGDGALQDDRSVIHGLIDEMDGGSGHARAVLEGLPLGMEALESREDGGMDVQDRIRKRMQEGRSHDSVEAGECDDVDAGAAKLIDDAAIECRSIRLTPVIDHDGGDAPFATPSEGGCRGTIRYDESDRGFQAAVGDGIGDGSQIGSPSGHQNPEPKHARRLSRSGDGFQPEGACHHDGGDFLKPGTAKCEGAGADRRARGDHVVDEDDGRCLGKCPYGDEGLACVEEACLPSQAGLRRGDSGAPESVEQEGPCAQGRKVRGEETCLVESTLSAAARVQGDGDERAGWEPYSGEHQRGERPRQSVASLELQKAHGCGSRRVAPVSIARRGIDQRAVVGSGAGIGGLSASCTQGKWRVGRCGEACGADPGGRVRVVSADRARLREQAVEQHVHEPGHGPVCARVLDESIADPECATRGRSRLYSQPASLYPRAVPLTEAQLTADLTQAMKAREKTVVSVLRGVVAAAKNAKIEQRSTELGSDDLVQIVRREIRKREEAADFARKAGRADLVDQNDAERVILEAYVPAAPTAAVLEETIRGLIADGQQGDMGSIMRRLKEQFGSALDGKAASALVRRLLSEKTGGG